MAMHKVFSDAAIRAALTSTCGNKAEASRILGMGIRQLQRRAKQLDVTERYNEVDIPSLPDRHPDVEEILETRKNRFDARFSAQAARQESQIHVKIDGPIGLMLFGDMHIDDDGSDIVQLERDATLCRETAGMYGINIGDVSNNWVGFLKGLYSHQATTERESWMLVEWFLKSVPWLVFCLGNHDLWNDAGYLLKQFLRDSPLLMEKHGIICALNFPNGRKVTCNFRHSFPGRSQWNPAHAISKAAQMGGDYNLLAAGHTHVSAYNIVKNAKTGIISHCVQLASYKVVDEYADRLGLKDHHISPAVVAVIDPAAKNEKSLIQIFHDVAQGAEFLSWLRGKNLK